MSSVSVGKTGWPNKRKPYDRISNITNMYSLFHDWVHISYIWCSVRWLFFWSSGFSQLFKSGYFILLNFLSFFFHVSLRTWCSSQLPLVKLKNVLTQPLNWGAVQLKSKLYITIINLSKAVIFFVVFSFNWEIQFGAIHKLGYSNLGI